MSKPSEKARRFLEDSLPELRELEQKKIFSKDEISRIARKRSDFEHILNSRNVAASDFVRCVEWELNLESLRKARISRLGMKKKAYYAGERRIMFVMDRGVRRFPADLELWVRYVNVAKKQKSYKKLSEILTSIVRLHPTKPEMWMFVASYAVNELGDMTQARFYMQRGLRFCKKSQDLWLEFFKLEILYTAKLAARRNILGLDGRKGSAALREGDETAEDFLALPAITAAEWEAEEPKNGVGEDEAPKDLRSTPALSGRIPIAIFDAAMSQFQDTATAMGFFDICEATNAECSRPIAEHIKEWLASTAPGHPITEIVKIKQPLVGVQMSSAEYPQVLGHSLSSLSTSVSTDSSRDLLALIVKWIASQANNELDQDIQKVLSVVASRLFELYLGHAQDSERSAADYVELLSLLKDGCLHELVAGIAAKGLERWPSNADLIWFAGPMVGAS